MNASLNRPTGVAYDLSGNLFIADHYNHRIRMVAIGSRIITTVAGTNIAGYGGDGGAATSASLRWPTNVLLDQSGNLIIAANNNMRIRMVAAPTRSPTPSATPSSTPYCSSALFRSLPRTDLVGALVGTAWTPGSAVPARDVEACRQACCDAPMCEGFSFATFSVMSPEASPCFVYVNISALIPSSGYASGVRESVL